MARIVLGVGCAHTPQLHTLARDWDIRAELDRADRIPLWWKGRKLSYAELLAERAGERLGEKLDLATRQAALDASFRAIDHLHARFVDAAPDVVVMVGNDQNEFFSEILPAFAVIAAPEMTNVPRTDEQNARLGAGIQLSDHGHLPETPVTFPGHPTLAAHLTRHLTGGGGFDVAFCREKPTVTNARSILYGLPHAYGFLYKNVLREHIRPCVPVDVNCWYYENSPTSGRCYSFGVALADALLAWEEDLRVAVLTTGGLSHFVVDPQWDGRLLDAMSRADGEALSSIPQTELMAGTSECKSWIAAAGVMDRARLKMRIVDYQALYRTEAGTGSACGFVIWQ